jgi:integrase
MIELFITAGLRSKELRGLRCQDVDIENKIILIKYGKGGYQRISLFGDSCVNILKEYFSVYNFAPDDIIFAMAQQNVINRTIKLWAAKAQINPHIHAHSFRHYFITESNRSGVPIEIIADQVGHRDLNSTRHYTHLDIEDVRAKYNNVTI